GPELELLEVVLDERLELVSRPHSRPPASPAPPAPALPWRSRRARRARRPPPADPPSPRASRASLRAASAAPRPCGAPPRRPRRRPGRLSPRATPEYPVHELARIPRRVPLRKRHRLVDRHLLWDVARLELVDRDAEDVALDDAEPVGGPAVRAVRDAPVEVRRLRLHGRNRRARELVRVGLELELSREVPLVEREQRAPPRGAPPHRPASA